MNAIGEQASTTRRPIRFGVNLPNFGEFADPRSMAELAVLAERSGWHGFFVWDHIVMADDLPIGDPWVILAAVACATERITIGPLVTPLPRRRPWVLARQAVSLDHLSCGRLVLGVGSGYPADLEFGTFGEPVGARERADLLDEGLAVLLGIWSGERFEHQGRHFQVRPTTFAPRPMQRPSIPIWVAATWPHTRPVRRACHFDGIYPLADVDGDIHPTTLEDIRCIADEVATGRGSLNGFEVAAPLHLTGDRQEDRSMAQQLADAGATFLQVGPVQRRETASEARRWIEAGPPQPDRPE